RVDQEVFVYRPRYRSAESLRSLVEPVIGSRSMMPMSAIAATPPAVTSPVQVPGAPISTAGDIAAAPVAAGVQARGNELVIVGSHD
ncbi:type II secretory pathway protein, partial [Burkholderia thailandensis]